MYEVIYTDSEGLVSELLGTIERVRESIAENLAIVDKVTAVKVYYSASDGDYARRIYDWQESENA